MTGSHAVNRLILALSVGSYSDSGLLLLLKSFLNFRVSALVRSFGFPLLLALCGYPDYLC